MTETPLYTRPADLLQALIRFNTTNPPGDEAACIAFLRGLLDEVGLASTVLTRTPGRPNLLARLPGRGEAQPLLLYGHVDVVTTANQTWQHPPFAAEIADGYIWGRGALDMKGGVAMMVAAFLRAAAEKTSLPGDVVLAIVSDEEAGGLDGARFLVEQHPGYFEGIRYAIGEFGGFTLQVSGKRFYPIMVAEKQACWLRARVRGPGGHGSMPLRGGSMARLARLLNALDRGRLPVHITPPARLMVEGLTAHLSGVTRLALTQLLNPALTDRVLDLMGPQGRLFDPLVHNTVSATIVRGGEKVNVIPSEITLEMDGRLLPGFKPDDLLAELKALAGPEVEYEVVMYDPGPSAPDMGWFDTLAGILKEADPAGQPAPLLLSAVTDARFFSRLGIQTYGYLPMQLPADLNFAQTIHAADERIPVESLAFGAEAIFKALQRTR